MNRTQAALAAGIYFIFAVLLATLWWTKEPRRTVPVAECNYQPGDCPGALPNCLHGKCVE